MSGRSVTLTADLGASVQSLKRRAQVTLGVGRAGRLLNSSGGVLDPDATLEALRLRTGDSLTLQIDGQTQVACSDKPHLGAAESFAAILGSGFVQTWGPQRVGGDSRAVQEQLKDVQQIQASSGGAFAAILGNGSVTTWGDADRGGDSRAVQDQLN